jgi:nucleotide-binding universal stress UspA family protein
MDMPSRITKVLCPTDGSHAAIKGVEFAINLVNNFTNMELTFLLVTRISSGQPDVDESRYRGATIIKAAEIQDHMELDAACSLAQEAGVDKLQCSKAYSRRNIAATIVDYADKEGFEHIVMGSTGRTGVSRVLLGSVASEVVAKAHCPVTVVR